MRCFTSIFNVTREATMRSYLTCDLSLNTKAMNHSMAFVFVAA